MLENPKPKHVKSKQDGKELFASFVQREVSPKGTEGLVNYRDVRKSATTKG